MSQFKAYLTIVIYDHKIFIAQVIGVSFINVYWLFRKLDHILVIRKFGNSNETRKFKENSG